MLFNSLHFLIFFPVVVAAFFLLPHRLRWILLLAASYYFYMSWNPAYGALLLATTVIDYGMGILMERTKTARFKRLFLFTSLSVNLGILFTFKYFNFFFETVAPLAKYFVVDFSSPALQLLLPVGLSFYVLQSLSYTIDVYRGARPAERHFGIFALYVSFFPQLVAGPIETSKHLLPQFYQKMVPDGARFVSGLRLMLWGFFKKIVIADNCGVIVDAIYGDVHGANGVALAAATFFFAIQIYADFSGYSDIARGSARILGYELSLNFSRPYFARSIAEFWRRWHKSLMHWFQEYIYFPLGGSRVSNLRWARNIGLVFLISGLWHGANLTFVAWGLLNAFYIVIGKISAPARTALAHDIYLDRFPRLQLALQVATTFILTLVTWVFFRAQSLTEAGIILSRIALESRVLIHDPSLFLAHIVSAGYALNTTAFDLSILLLAITLLFAVEYLSERKVASPLFARLPLPLRWGAYYVLIGLIIFAGYLGKSTFIYFQF